MLVCRAKCQPGLATPTAINRKKNQPRRNRKTPHRSRARSEHQPGQLVENQADHQWDDPLNHAVPVGTDALLARGEKAFPAGAYDRTPVTPPATNPIAATTSPRRR
jgi:hypothetical protein